MYSIFKENRIGNPDWTIRRQRWRTTLDTIHRTKTCKHKREHGHYTMNPLYSWSACHQMANREFRFNIGLLVYNTKGVNNSEFSDFVDCIYTVEQHIKDTTYTLRSASYIDVYLEIIISRPRTKQYFNRDDFNLPIVAVWFICSSIPTEPTY
jgi:hypothetical protein